MAKWLLIFEQRYSENTPEYGCGDYPEPIPYLGAVIEADTKRKAQIAAKTIYPRIKFGGMFSPRLIDASERRSRLYTKPADPRLSLIRQERHQTALKAL
jgi:hypothetical protein